MNQSNLGVVDIIKQKYGNSISNLSIIDKSFKYSSYELKPFINLALVFNGTLNLEYMLLNVPVVSTGTSSTSGMNFTREIKNKSQYKKIFTDENYDFSNFLVKSKKNKKRLITFSSFWFIKRYFSWNKKNYFPGNRLNARIYRFRGFGFKSLNNINLKDLQTKRLINFIKDGKFTIK